MTTKGTFLFPDGSKVIIEGPQETIIKHIDYYFGHLTNPEKPEPSKGARNSNPDTTEFPDFASFFDKTNPNQDTEKALVGGYWLQVIKEFNDFSSSEVNKELRNVGHAISHIAMAYQNLNDQNPRLVMQVSKSGRTQQARKKYRVTSAGIEYVENMITTGGGINDGE